MKKRWEKNGGGNGGEKWWNLDTPATVWAVPICCGLQPSPTPIYCI